MLENTFCHFPGIGLKTEAKLWNAGVLTWDDLEKDAPAGGSWPVGPGRLATARSLLDACRTALDAGDARVFYRDLPPQEQWRIFPHFRHSAAYVDIETTGTGCGMDHITTIALYDGREVKTYVHGRNLEDFVDDIAAYDLLVTFNGKCFDVPFIEREFNCTLDQAHIDLRFVLKAAGIGGGLKKVEHQLGLSRGDLDGVDGYWAVLLWKEFEATRDETVLETLIAYNVEDVIALELLAATAFNLHLERTPFAHRRLDPPLPGLNPFAASTAVLDTIRRRYFY
ncbi:ribonuclease H-like domain-containing protein [Oceanidesulfovibrio marinus]|uniref:Exonuclease n=1 Tax=Oceanidesulfovibrio marinus TaxID=370038 RepID=A0ABX6NLB7_9BACT|nr:ribonuclease H-like domain-containing protein [Oceanidesulfovibrio marinus]QJT10435.1 exonuclease [Oceanidesulfovibrio marinus]